MFEKREVARITSSRSIEKKQNCRSENLESKIKDRLIEHRRLEGISEIWSYEIRQYELIQAKDK